MINYKINLEKIYRESEIFAKTILKLLQIGLRGVPIFISVDLFKFKREEIVKHNY